MLPPVTVAPQKISTFPAGAIAGIVIGVLVIFGLGAGLFFLLGRQKATESERPTNASDNHSRRSNVPSFYSPTATGTLPYDSPAFDMREHPMDHSAGPVWTHAGNGVYHSPGLPAYGLNIAHPPVSPNSMGGHSGPKNMTAEAPAPVEAQ